MKNILYLLFLGFILANAACQKENKVTMTVVRDCTGTYLQKDGKDYHVCNLEKVKNFDDGAKVTASYKRLKECKGSGIDQIVCLMYHQNEGWIEVTDIK
jgi:hypothetical protein